MMLAERYAQNPSTPDPFSPAKGEGVSSSPLSFQERGAGGERSSSPLS